jgi:hypothetical protein
MRWRLSTNSPLRWTGAENRYNSLEMENRYNSLEILTKLLSNLYWCAKHGTITRNGINRHFETDQNMSLEHRTWACGALMVCRVCDNNKKHDNDSQPYFQPSARCNHAIIYWRCDAIVCNKVLGCNGSTITLIQTLILTLTLTKLPL